MATRKLVTFSLLGITVAAWTGTMLAESYSVSIPLFLLGLAGFYSMLFALALRKA